MAQLSSFDIVSQIDRQEFRNALDQTMRELTTRFDLKDTKTEIAVEETRLTINTASEMTLTSVRDLLESKLIRRGLSLKILDYGKVEPASGGRVRQEVKLKQGISDDLGREIVKKLRAEHKKVQAQIQGETVRVSAKVKDDLQAVIQDLRGQDYPVPLQFINYR
jgi:cyclic-di-GMP-binding protein